MSYDTVPAWQSRTAMLVGNAGIEALCKTRVALFGVGGVGSWCAEALARGGVGHIMLVDFDTVAPSNINRQMPALATTVGRPKVDVVAERLRQINPDISLEAVYSRVTADNLDDFNLGDYQFVVDAIDSAADKAALILYTLRLKGPRLISSMGAALRFDPTQVRVSRFDRVEGCALARALRQQFKRAGLQRMPRFVCAHSLETPQMSGRHDGVNGSLCPVTATFGLAIAARVLAFATAEGELLAQE